jgi:hypothetical protein
VHGKAGPRLQLLAKRVFDKRAFHCVDPDPELAAPEPLLLSTPRRGTEPGGWPDVPLVIAKKLLGTFRLCRCSI